MKIRSDRLKWLGHALRSDQSNLVRQAVVVLVEDCNCLAGMRSAEGTVTDHGCTKTHNIGATAELLNYDRIMNFRNLQGPSFAVAFVS